MSSHQLDPRSMKDVEGISNFNPALQPQYMAKESAWASWVQFAAVMLFLVGSLHVIEGLVALFRDQVYVVSEKHLVIGVDYTTWGWLHLVVGVVMILVGAGLLTGRMIARILGVAIAFVSTLMNIAFMPAYPFWSAILILIDLVVIWAIIVHGKELKPVRPPT